MPVIPSNELIHVEIVMAGVVSGTGVSAKNFFNVFHFRRTNLGLPVDKGQIEAAFQTAIADGIVALLNAAYVQSYNSVRFLDDATDPPEITTHSTAGGITGAAQENFDAVTVQIKTGYRGKNGRGAKHFGPLSNADSVGNTLTSGAITAWQAAMAAYLAGFVDAGANQWLPVIFSRKLSFIKSNPTTVFTNDVTRVVLNKTLGTMRRRKIRTVTA